MTDYLCTLHTNWLPSNPMNIPCLFRIQMFAFIDLLIKFRGDSIYVGTRVPGISIHDVTYIWYDISMQINSIENMQFILSMNTNCTIIASLLRQLMEKLEAIKINSTNSKDLIKPWELFTVSKINEKNCS